MSEFKFVQWGKGVPVDYQRLNAMMLNEQYLKDIADVSPRGILAQALTTSDFSTSTSVLDFTAITNMSAISFTVDANRIIKITVNGNYVDNPDVTGTLSDYTTSISIYFDGSATSSFSTQCYNPISKRATFPTLIYSTPTALSAGTHTLAVKAALFTFDTAPTAQILKAPINCIIEDIGSSI
jgi:hypothetical protein